MLISFLSFFEALKFLCALLHLLQGICAQLGVFVHSWGKDLGPKTFFSIEKHCGGQEIFGHWKQPWPSWGMFHRISAGKHLAQVKMLGVCGHRAYPSLRSIHARRLVWAAPCQSCVRCSAVCGVLPRGPWLASRPQHHWRSDARAFFGLSWLPVFFCCLVPKGWQVVLLPNAPC